MGPIDGFQFGPLKITLREHRYKTLAAGLPQCIQVSTARLGCVLKLISEASQTRDWLDRAL